MYNVCSTFPRVRGIKMTSNEPFSFDLITLGDGNVEEKYELGNEID